MAKPASERPLPGTLIDPLYPDEDGRFKGETDFHTHARKDLHECLEVFFDPVPDVYVTSNLIYY